MNKNPLTHFVIRKSLALTFFVLVTLSISENIFAIRQWTSQNVKISWNQKRNCILFAIDVYDYQFGPRGVHGYLQNCSFEATVDGVNYYSLMEITTPMQEWSECTKVRLKNKLANARIEFLFNVVYPRRGTMWPEDTNLDIIVKNHNNSNVVYLGWHVGRQVSSVRISGTWGVGGRYSDQTFNNIDYPLRIPAPAGLNAKISKNEIAKVFKVSEAIVVKGAKPGAKIKVYNPSGVEIKSVVSDNDVVKIKLPAKQFYVVHVGDSRHKVAM